MTCQIYQGENLSVLRSLNQEVSLVYMDPPFNTGQTQERGDLSYEDQWDTSQDYRRWLMERIAESWLRLTPTGSLFIHLDQREVHYVKVMLDSLLGRDRFQNEIVWAYDYGGRSRSRWSKKHDTILWYTKDPQRFTFNYDEIDRIPYLAPSLVGPEKAAKGKTPTDVWEDKNLPDQGLGTYWWQTIVPTNGKEKTGYPTQKPLGLLTRIIKVHTNPGETVLDPFAGSGTTGHAALLAGRNAVLIDENPQAVEVMKERLAPWLPEVVVVDSRL